MIQFIRNHCGGNCCSEWMRTKNGRYAAVSCMVREKENQELYAYAYVHAILTFFRQYDIDSDEKLNDGKIAQLLLEYCKYACQKLDASLETKTGHPLPYISVFFEISDGKAAALTIGDASVTILNRDKKEIALKRSSFSRSHLKNCRISGKGLPSRAVKLRVFDTSATEEIILRPVNLPEWTDYSGESMVIRTCPDAENPLPHIYRTLITGRKHASKGQYCQDNADFRILADGSVCAAVSDGAGGGNCSEYGAVMNVNTFLACCEDGISLEDFGTELLQRIHQAHNELQTGKPVDAIQDYATLMGVYIKGDTLFCLHIGDGAVYGKTADGSVECISDPDNYLVSNRTYFTIEADAADHLSICELPKSRYDSLLLMTDGVYNGYHAATSAELFDTAAEGECSERDEFIGQVFSLSEADGFDDAALARLIDTEEVLRYGDDHSAVLIQLNDCKNIRK